MRHDAELQDIRRRAGLNEEANEEFDSFVDLVVHRIERDRNPRPDSYWVMPDSVDWIPRWGTHDNIAIMSFGGWPTPNEGRYEPRNAVKPEIDQHLHALVARMGTQKFGGSFIAMLHGWVRLMIQYNTTNKTVELNIEVTDKRLNNRPLKNMVYLLSKLQPYVQSIVIEIISNQDPSQRQHRIFQDTRTAIGFLKQV